METSTDPTIIAWLKEWADLISLGLAIFGGLLLWALRPTRVWITELVSGARKRSALVRACNRHTLERVREYKEAYVPGTSTFKQGYALEDSTFVDALELSMTSPPRCMAGSTAVSELVQTEDKVLICGDRGIGKSLIAHVVASRLLHRKKPQKSPIPLLLNLVELLTTSDDKIVLTRDQTSYRRRDLEKLMAQNKVAVILDGLDEALQSLSLKGAKAILDSAIVKDARYLFCRTSYYQSVLQYLELDRPVWSIVLQKDGRQSLIQKLGSLYFEEPSFENLKTELLRFSARHAFLPLDIHVLLELTKMQGLQAMTSDSILQIYREYVDLRMKSVVSSKDVQLTPDEALEYHLRFAAEAQTSQTRTANVAGIISLSELEWFQLPKSESLSTFIMELVHFGLIRPSDTELGTTLRFRHWRYQDYLASETIVRALQTGSNADKRLWRSFLHQELGLFLKQAITEINQDDEALSRITHGFCNRIEDELSIFETATKGGFEYKISRCALGQLFYYAGHLKSEKARSFLTRLSEAESLDTFLKRSIAIGLAFGGQPEKLNSFVGSLVLERSDPESELNRENIGHQLTYFGDQAFDFLDPSRIDRLGPCGETIEKLLLQLCSSELSGSWRLDAYTIVYLANTEPWNIAAREKLKSNLSLFRQVTELLAEHPPAKKWPELNDFFILVKEIEDEYQIQKNN